MSLSIRRACVAMAWCLAVSATAWGQTRAVPVAPVVEWATREVRAAGVTYHTFESALAKTRVSYHLFTPSGKAEGERLPVVYWLHGSGGGAGGIGPTARRFSEAMAAGKMPRAYVVFVNGMVNGMYVDWKDGSVPLESVIVKELIPEVDRAHETVAGREGRVLDGFSMGGYGAGRLGFKFVELFSAVSMVGAGPMQEDLLDAPRAGRRRAVEVLERVYGGDPAYFLAVSPRTLVAARAKEIAEKTKVRLVIGGDDNTLPANEAFHELLTKLEIPHEWTVVPGVGHDPMRMREAMGESDWAWYRAVLGR